MNELKTEYLDPRILKPYKNNAKKHGEEDLEKIKKSIQDFGFNDPVGVWGKDNCIVEDHGRQIAAIELGIDKIPVIHLDHLTAGPDTLDWCFEGIEGGGTVAVSTVGVMRDSTARDIWRSGMARALEEIKPKTVVCYGTEMDFDFSPADVVTIKARGFSE